MPLNIRDAQNSWLEAKTRWEKFIVEYVVKWKAPEMLDNIAQAVNNTPQVVLDRLPEDTHSRLSELRGGQNART